MFILDSDHMSLLEWGSTSSAVLRERLASCDESEVATTIINYEEQIRGWMAYLAKAKSIPRQIEAYRRLRTHLDNYRRIRVIDFDAGAASEYEGLRKSRVRIGTMDLKIASIVKSRDATLLTCNRQDFEQVEGLKFEDWTTDSE